MKTKQPKPQSTRSGAGELRLRARVQREVLAWFWVALAFMLVNGAVGQARIIPSGSMENTVLIGDHLIMSRVGYDAGIPFSGVHVPLWRNPKRQQIVIFKPPYDPTKTDLIKRVIGLPGDELDIRQGAAWINGQRLQENYTRGRTEPAPFGQAPPGFPEVKFPYRVPQNAYFVMGDNRQNSYDSRFWGAVPRTYIIGTAVVIYMSVDAPDEAWNGSVLDRFQAYGRALLHPRMVRWERIFETF